ncbi:MAG: IS30 family transposase [Bergeyella zoohelcum]|nr:IS30 family transposase [Bergeyella zoohelcum]
MPISQRPTIVNDKKRFGDWEVDLIEGKNHSSFALTLVERKSAFCLVQKLENKKAETVAKAIINSLAPYRKWVKTITSDNGKEFSNHERISAKLGIDYYFADPYSSWQRGLNEYTNKLIRQYLPKKSNLKNFDNQYIKDITIRLNNRPRKKLNFDTPQNVFLSIFAKDFSDDD